MKNVKAAGIFLCLTVVFFSSCVKDQCMRTFKYFEPVYRTTQEVRANIRSNASQPIERPGKLFIKGQYIFLNETDRGIHIIDNNNPSSPKNVAFIDIPGNIDLAVKGNFLYADAYTDLVVLDISNPLQVSVKKIVEDVFPFRYYGSMFAADTSKVIVDWQERDTTVQVNCGTEGFFGISTRKDVFVLNSCSNCATAYSAGGSNSPFGVGGSMARFSIMNDYLYTVSNSHLNVFNISNPVAPDFRRDVSIGWDIETIYPFKSNLFIGSMSGMYIFSVANPDNPVQTGSFTHARSCDPVVADDEHAFITLRSGSACQGFSNQLDVVNVKNTFSPFFIKTYQMTNPHGLSKDGDLLFICDGDAGLKIFNAADVLNINQIHAIDLKGTYDVIARAGLAIVVAADGIYQYDYSDLNNIRLISKIIFT